MSTMSEGVLAYSSINATEKQIGLVELNNIVEDIRNDLEVIIQQKGAEIKSEPLPKIEGAYVLIYQLFYNLINNSLKFAKPNEKPSISIIAKMITALDLIPNMRKEYFRLSRD